MKDLLKAIVLLIICVFIISCKKTVTAQKGAFASAEFPPFLAGTWAAEEGMWQMTFKPDGSLESIKFYFVSAPIDTAKGAADETGENGFDSTWKLGDNRVKYNPDTMRLEVEVKISYFKVVRPMGTFEGNMVHTFKGIVSEDHKTWDVNWVNVTEINDFPEKSTDELSLVFKHIDSQQ